MDKQIITEEMHLEKDWFDRASKVSTTEELTQFVDEMMNSYEHDYGTACHAVAACALAGAWLGSQMEGITGMQASFVMWDFIRYWIKSSNECGLRLVDYDDFLYPQYKYKYDKTISKETWRSIQDEAKRLLEEDDNFVCAEVKNHWLNIVSGIVPFGYTVENN